MIIHYFFFGSVVECLCKLSESGFSGFKDLQDELGVTHLNVQSLMNWATTRVAPTVLCRDVNLDLQTRFDHRLGNLWLRRGNVAFYDGDFISVQTVELIDYLINQFIGTLNAGEQGVESGEAACKFTLKRFLEISV